MQSKIVLYIIVIVIVIIASSDVNEMDGGRGGGDHSRVRYGTEKAIKRTIFLGRFHFIVGSPVGG